MAESSQPRPLPPEEPGFEKSVYEQAPVRACEDTWKWSGALKDARDRLREAVPLGREIPARKAGERGLVKCAVPASQLDEVVDDWAAELAGKLRETTRYAKQQLNARRDLAWHQTVNHARGWLALSMLGTEAQGTVECFPGRER